MTYSARLVGVLLLIVGWAHFSGTGSPPASDGLQNGPEQPTRKRPDIPTVEVLLDRLRMESVESLSPLNVSIGGRYVSGSGDRKTLHPLLQRGKDAEPLLLKRIRTYSYPFRELLLYHAIRGWNTPLEMRVMMLEEPTAREINRAAMWALTSRHTKVHPRVQDAKVASVPDSIRSRKLVAMIDQLYDLEVETRDHFNVSIGAYNVSGIPLKRLQVHPLLGFGNEPLAFLAAVIISDDCPVRELLIYNAILDQNTAIEDAIVDFRLPSSMEIWGERIRIMTQWEGSRALAEARTMIDKYFEPMRVITQWEGSRALAEAHAIRGKYGDQWQGKLQPEASRDSSDGGRKVALEELRQIMTRIPSEKIVGDERMTITLGGHHLAGPSLGRERHPIFAYGRQVIPLVAEKMAVLTDDLPWVLIVNALDRRTTRVEADIFRGCTPDFHIVRRRSWKIQDGLEDFRAPVSEEQREGNRMSVRKDNLHTSGIR